MKFTATIGYVNYQWGTPGVVLATTSTPECYLTISNTGSLTYCVTATNSLGQSASDCITFEAIECCYNEPVRLIYEGSISSALSLGALPSKIAIMDDLNIDQNYYFPGVSDIVMLEGSEIIVELGLQAEMNSIHIRGCNKMWGNIELWNYAELKMKNCIVEDGIKAIDVLGNNTILDLEGNLFRKNYISLRFNSDAVELFEFQQLIFDDNEFHCENLSLLYPFTGDISFAGVEIRNCKQFDIAYSSEYPNLFHHMRNGIILNNSNSHIYSHTTRFWDINSTLPDEGYGIRATSDLKKSLFLVKEGDGTDFSNCKYGIYSKGMNITARGNYILNSQYGIRVDLSQYCQILLKNNVITCNEAGIFLYNNDPVLEAVISENSITINSPANVGHGIHIEENGNPPGVQIFNNQLALIYGNYGIFCQVSKNSLIRNNIIYLNNNSSALAGIQIAGGKFNTVECNVVTGPGRNLGNPDEKTPRAINVISSEYSNLSCNEMDETFVGLGIEDICTNSEIKGNVFVDHYFGLLFNPQGTTGLQQDHGNLWTGSYTRGAVHEAAINNPTPIWQSLFLVKPWTPPTKPPTIQSSYTWFSISGFPDPTYSCSESSACTIHLPASPVPMATDSVLTQLDFSIASDSLNFASYDPELNWTADRALFSKLSENQILITSSALIQNFYDSAQFMSPGLFEQIELEQKDILKIQFTDQVFLDSLMNKINHIHDSMSYSDSIMNTGISTLDSLNLVIIKQELQQELESYRAQLDTALETLRTIRDNQIPDIISDNMTLPAAELYESNEKLIRDIYLNTIALGTDSFSVSQLNDIRNIACQCPLAGGNSVYLARSLYSGIVDTLYNDKLLCLQAGYVKNIGNPTTTQVLSSTAFHFLPNPAVNELQVFWDQDLENPGQIKIYSLAGQVILDSSIPEKSHSIRVDLFTIPGGTYMVKISDGKKLMAAHKLVIIK